MKPIRKYKTIAGLLKDPKRWDKGCNAATKKGGPGVDPWSPKAQVFCLNGAVQRVYPKRSHRRVRRALDTASFDLFPKRYSSLGGLEHFNDHLRTRHADVLKVARKAKV